MSPSFGRSQRNRWRLGRGSNAQSCSSAATQYSSIAALEDVGSAADGQAIGCREDTEVVAVEADQPLGSCEPDEPLGIGDDAVDGRSDAVTGGENGRGEALGPDRSGRNERQTHPCEERPCTPTTTRH